MKIAHFAVLCNEKTAVKVKTLMKTFGATHELGKLPDELNLHQELTAAVAEVDGDAIVISSYLQGGMVGVRGMKVRGAKIEVWDKWCYLASLVYSEDLQGSATPEQSDTARERLERVYQPYWREMAVALEAGRLVRMACVQGFTVSSGEQAAVAAA